MRRLLPLFVVALCLPAVPARAAQVTVGRGRGAHVFVDAAGTAHIVWASGSDVQYCRLKRAATACDATATLSAPGTTASVDSLGGGGPVIYGVGNALVVVDLRQTDDGERVLAWVSTTGGADFSDPGAVGEGFRIDNPSIQVGAAENPGRMFIDDESPIGANAVVHTITGGAFTPNSAGVVVSADKGRGSGLTLDGGTPVALVDDYFNGEDSALFRQAGSGWGSPVKLPGDGRLTGGPNGLLFFTRKAAGDVIHKITGSSVGSGHVVSTENTHVPFDRLVQTASGKTIAVYNTIADEKLLAKTSSNGLTWPKSATTLLSKDAKYFDAGATDDGGGFAVIEVDHGNVDTDPIVASSFGTQAPTGKPGVGGVAGGGTTGGGDDDPGAHAHCGSITFGAVELRPSKGTCFLPAGGKFDGFEYAEGPVDINGLTITPNTGGRVYVAEKKHKVVSSGIVTISAEQAGVAPVVLWHGMLKLHATKAGAGDQLFDFSGSGVTVEGFPVKGDVPVVLTKGGTSIPLQLSLPAGFSFDANVTLTTGVGKGLSLPSLTIGPFESDFGVIGFQGITLKYAGGASDDWTGSGSVLIPENGGFQLDATVEFKGTHFVGGSLTTHFPFPGLQISAAPIYLSKVAFHVATESKTGEPDFELGGGASFGALPFGPIYSVGVDGDLTFTSKPVQVIITGAGQILSFPVATGTLTFQPSKGFSGDLHTGADLGFVSLDADAKVGVTHSDKWHFNGSADLSASVFGYNSGPLAAVAFDDRGFGICFAVVHIIVRWRSGPDGDWGCNLDEFKTQGLRRRRADGGAVASFTVPKGAVGYNIHATGSASRVPDVSIIDPNGSPVGAQHFAEPTNVVEALHIQAPAAGTYTVVPNPGSVEVTKVETAQQYGSPTATATLKKGRLHVKVANPDSHLFIRIAEQLPTGALHPLADVRGTALDKRVKIAVGAAGPRKLIAEVLNLPGNITSSHVAGSFVAPGPPKPSRVRGVHVRHHGLGLAVSWKKAKHATSYSVIARIRGGASVLRRTSGHKVTVPAIAPRARGTVSVQPHGVLATTGRATRKRFR